MRDVIDGVRLFFGLAWRADPVRSLLVVGLALLDAVFASLAGLWVKMITDGVVQHDTRTALTGAVALALSIGTALAGGVVAMVTRARIIEHAQVLFERDLATLTMSIPGIEQHERPEFLDRLQLLRGEAAAVVQSSWALLDLLSLAARIVGTSLLLASVHPALVLLLLFTLPAVRLGGRAQRMMQDVTEAIAEQERLAGELDGIATSAGAAGELRIFGLTEEIDTRCRQAYDRVTSIVVRATAKSSALHLLGSVTFQAAYLGAVLWTASRVSHGGTSLGDLALVVAAGQQVQGHASGAIGVLGQAMSVTRAMSRLRWLRHYRDTHVVSHPDPVPVPGILRKGITLRDVSFTYPGTDACVLADIDLFLPAGSTVAVVGVNGAGKTTLVKLLCRLYKPTSGTITVDDVALERMDTTEWRTKLAAGFQDFVRFELLLRQSVGIGEVSRIDDADAVTAALHSAEAMPILAHLADGLETSLGKQFDENGVELSVGQWQRLALARANMRQDPLVLILDEPTAALDADAEHHLFERYSAAARTVGQRTGAITVIISHRFSTVRHADKILVLDGGRVSEVGNHDQLMANHGTYSELFEIQAAAYR